MRIHSKNKNMGFSLMEILVVIAIIGSIASVIIVRTRVAKLNAQISHSKLALTQFRNAIGTLASDTALWPGKQEVGAVGSGSGNEICEDGCTYGINDCESGLICDDSYPGWNGPYLGAQPIDPWGNEYFFDTDYDYNAHMELPGQRWTAVIGSYGPDGQGNNDYGTDDIVLILASE